MRKKSVAGNWKLRKICTLLKTVLTRGKFRLKC